MKHKYESTERFTNLKDLLNHLTKGGVVTNMDDSCPSCGVFLDDDGVLRFIASDEEYPEANSTFSNKTAGDYRPLPTRLIVKYLQKVTRNK